MIVTKDPDAVLDYLFDWSAWLGDDTIDSHDITAAGGITIDSSTDTDTTVTVWVSGGTADSRATATCRITTTGGRIDDRTMVLSVVER